MDRRNFVKGLVLTIPASMTLPGLAAAADGFDLITVTEFGKREDRTPTRRLTRLKSDGPEIMVHAPHSTRMSSPVDFDVEFVAKDGVPPLMGSIKIDYDMGLFWKDVTGRLMKHATIKGTRLRCNGARLPGGRHILRLSILDKQRRATVTKLEINVAG